MQFIDLAEQQTRIRDRLDAAMARVLDEGQFIMGPQVAQLEEQLADFAGTAHCVSCANGTDALQLALMALEIRSGDAVFVPSFTFAATAEVVPCMGAVPVFVDIDPATYNMDPSSLERAISHAKSIGLKPRALIPVDLFGLPADYPALSSIAEAKGLTLIEDSAQGFGGMIGDRVAGSFGTLATTSFFPAKPLGCYGDGGALFTNDPNMAALLDSLRVHGKGAEKYDNVRIGMNSRLDTLQAAILIEKLAIYADEIGARNRVAERYTVALHNRLITPHVPDGYRSIWAQYTLRAKSSAHREMLMSALREKGIPSAVYYPRPLHTQGAYAAFPQDPAGLSASEDAAATVFSLPMHPYLTADDQDRVVSALLAAMRAP